MSLYDKSGKKRVRKGWDPLKGIYWPDGALHVSDNQAGHGIWAPVKNAYNFTEWKKRNKKYSDVTVAYTDNTALLAGLGTDLFELWDADVSASFTLVSTDHISAWVGQKNSVSLAQGSDARRPQYLPTGWKSTKPCLYFEGSALRNLITTSFTNLPSGSTPFEVWLVVDQPDVAGTKVPFGTPNNTAGQHADITYFKDPNNKYRLTATGTASSSTNASVSFADGFLGPVVIRGRWEATRVMVGLGSAVQTSLMSVSSQVLGLASSGVFALGSGAANGGFWGGKVRKLVVTKPLDDTKAYALYQYLLASM